MFRLSSMLTNTKNIMPMLGILEYARSNESRSSTPLTAELLQTAASMMRVNSIDFLYLAHSLPRRQLDLHAHTSLASAELSAGHVVEFGSNCTSILDAIHYSASIYIPGMLGIVACSDCFGTQHAIRTNSREDWRDGAGAILIGRGTCSFRICSYVCGNDPTFSKESPFINDELNVSFSDAFYKTDIENELLAAQTALNIATTSWDDIDGYITVNRSRNRTQKLQKRLPLPSHKIFNSRAQIGHVGGSDLIFNLKKSISAYSEREKIRLLLVGNGLGYTWNAMRIDVIADR